jgi:hypothetical protein
VVEKQASISLSELLEQIHANAKELHEAAVLHKKQFVDGGVPVAPCLTNLVMPILQAKLPEKMIPRLQKRERDEKDSATEMSKGIAQEHDAVGRATAQEEEKKKTTRMSSARCQTKLRRGGGRLVCYSRQQTVRRLRPKPKLQVRLHVVSVYTTRRKISKVLAKVMVPSLPSLAENQPLRKPVQPKSESQT